MTPEALLEAALSYGARGWQVVPLHNLTDTGACSCGRAEGCDVRNRGKHPRLKEWHLSATSDEKTITSWWAKWPTANIGILLGQKSGVVDLECDTPEATRALIDMFDGMPPIVPRYSSSRGDHYLFQWSPELDQLRQGNQAVFKWRGIEFRIGGGNKGSQSVFPPSKHPSGTQYAWKISIDETDLLPIPEEVLRLLKTAQDPSRGPGNLTVASKDARAAAYAANGQAPPAERWKLYEQDAVVESVDGRDNVLYSEACALWGEQVRLHGVAVLEDLRFESVVYTRLQGLNLTKCRPPMDEKVVLVKCKSAQKFFVDQRSTAASMTNLTDLGLEYRDGEYWPGQWQLHIINGDPSIARLWTPFIPKACVDMTLHEFDDPKGVHIAIFGATGTVCIMDRPALWPSVWNGFTDKDKMSHRGLKAKLIESAVVYDADPEVRRESVMAQMLLEHFGQAKKLSGNDLPDTSHPSRFPDGSVTFAFNKALEPMQMSPDQFTRGEFGKLMEEIKAKATGIRCKGGTSRRLFKLSNGQIQKLDLLANSGGEKK
jgi:hypothetical protein